MIGGNENTARSQAMFGDYDIIETVGQGGMGVVYRAFDTKLGRVVALKVLKDDLRSNRQVTARFQREGEAFASLNHPNIVHIYSVGAAGRIPYISMEYIAGHSLSVIMKREKKLEWKRALFIAQQVAEALASAHEAHIIHRDIKPGNVMIDKEDHAYVTDFGIAKVLTAETQLTVEGSRLGTPQYMSPERCLNKEITASSDIYSLGVLVFQMITGRLPYDASKPIELIQKIVSDPPKRLSAYVPDIPRDIERLVAYMIEKEPKNRPESAQKLAELIQRVSEGKALHVDESGLAASLGAFRDASPTPMSSSTPYSGMSSAFRESVSQRMLNLWKGISERVRVGIVGGIIVIVAALVGFQIGDWLNSGYAIDAVRQANTGILDWSRSATVADFQSESDGIELARMNLPNFAVSRVVAADNDVILVELAGLPKSPRRGHKALAVVSPSGRRAHLGISPKVSLTNRAAFSLEAAMTDVSGESMARYAIVRNETLASSGDGPAIFTKTMADDGAGTMKRLLDAYDLRTLAGLSDVHTLGPIAVAPDARSAVVALEQKGGKNWSLWTIEFSSAGRPETAIRLVDALDRIEWISMDTSRNRVLYATRENDGGMLLSAIEMGAIAGLPEIVYDGGGVAPAKAYHAGRGALITYEAASGGENEVSVVYLDGVRETIHLGLGGAAAWHPSGRFVLAMLPDRKGNLQLWSVSVANPEERDQLTFLADGAAALCSVSSDGRWAVAGMNEGGLPSLVIADLAKVPAMRSVVESN